MPSNAFPVHDLTEPKIIAPPMTAADKYTAEAITEVRSWTPKLFSFRTSRYRGYILSRRGKPGHLAVENLW